MNIDGRLADQTSTRYESITDRSASSSEMMLAEVRSYQESPNTIGRRSEPRSLEFSNPFTPAGNDRNSDSPHSGTNNIDQSSDYTRELGPDGRPLFRDRVGLEVQTLGDVSPEFQQRMLQQIQLLPEADRRQLAEAGIRVIIAGRVTDAEPSIANERPRNWPSRSTQEDADGIYLGDQRAVVVAEHTRRGPNNRAEGVLRHEVGHALNDALGNFSESREFVQAYQEDVARMDRTQRARLSFWLQARGAGRDEALADVYAALRGGVPNAEQTRQILQAFPRVAEIVRRRLGR